MNPPSAWVNLLPLKFIPQRKGLIWYTSFAEDVSALKQQMHQLYNEKLVIRITRATTDKTTAELISEIQSPDINDPQVDVEMDFSDVSFHDIPATQQQQVDDVCRDNLPAPNLRFNI
jgi:hypothetical protein